MNNTTKGGITLGVVAVVIIAIFFAVNSGNTEDDTISSDTNSAPQVSQQPDTDPTTSSMAPNETSQPTELPMLEEATPVGTYLPYSEENFAQAEGTNTVIFFSASWCPTCQALRRNLEDNLSEFPSDLTVLTADFDSETALRQEFGVTNQHTLIKVDANRNELSRDVGQIFTLNEVVEFSES
jgi:thiol-disulfide isomerase/thioredoxin